MNRLTLLLAAFLTSFATLAQSSWGIAPTEPAIQQVNLRPQSGLEPQLWFLPDAPTEGPAVFDFESNIPVGYVVAESQACVAQIVDWDDFCVTTEWDGICQDQYDCCASSGEFFNLTCNDPGACNYDSNSCLSGLAGTAASCLYDDDCSENCVTVVLTDTQGDGWNGGNYSIVSANGDVVQSGFLLNGYSSTFGLCLEDGCYEFVINDGGTFPQEIGWQILGVNGGSVSGAYGDPFAINTINTFGLGDAVVDMTANAWDLYFTPFGDEYELTLNADGTGIDNNGFEFPWILCGSNLVLDGYVNMQWNGLFFRGVGMFEDINLEDIILVPSDGNDCPGDLSGDGQVTNEDLLDFLTAFGSTCE